MRFLSPLCKQQFCSFESLSAATRAASTTTVAMSITRTHFENNEEVGAFSKLTNSYCLVAVGGSENFYATFEAELEQVGTWQGSGTVRM